VGFAAYLEEKVLPWFAWIEKVYGIPGFHAWDATAALYLTDPHLFEPRNVLPRSTLEDLQNGYLRFDEGADDTTLDRDSRWINVPKRIRDLSAYWKTLFTGWRNTGEGRREQRRRG
jgi:hypothetical protein